MARKAAAEIEADTRTTEELNAIQSAIGDSVYQFCAVHALAEVLYNNGSGHPDPGGWIVGALFYATKKLALELEAAAGFNIVTPLAGGPRGTP